MGTLVAQEALGQVSSENAPVSGACVRFIQVSEPFSVCRSFSSLVFPATRGPQKPFAAGLCPAKLCGKTARTAFSNPGLVLSQRRQKVNMFRAGLDFFSRLKLRLIFDARDSRLCLPPGIRSSATTSCGRSFLREFASKRAAPRPYSLMERVPSLGPPLGLRRRQRKSEVSAGRAGRGAMREQ